MKPLWRSLHLRLVVWLALMLGTTWVAFWANSQATVARTAAADIDRQLKIDGFQLFQLFVDDDSPGRRAAAPPIPASDLDAGQDTDEDLATAQVQAPSFEIVTAENRVLARSGYFPQALRSTAPGLETRFIEDMAWRVFTVTDDRRRITGRFAVDQPARDARTAALNRDFTRPLLWLLPVLALAAVFSVWRGLVPLREIEQAIARQNPDDLKPLELDTERVPTELRGLLYALDRLFNRLDAMLARRHAFTAAAGHEMRSPLAGCRVQVEIAQRSKDAADRDRALALVGQAIDRMAYLVSQLLLLARVDATAAQIKCERLDISRLVQRVVTTRAASADEKGVTLKLQVNAAPAPIDGDATLIETAIGNLIDNAIRFSPAAADVEIDIDRSAKDVVVAIRDHGRGITEAECDHVFDHFYRSRDEVGPGSGLGLTIVQAVATAHRGHASLQPAPGAGTRAVLRLPVGGTHA